MTDNQDTSESRESRELREHETYEQENWTVIDVTGVDKVFATPTTERYDEEVRLDIDGFGAESMMNDLPIEGDNINSSLWLPLPEAVELRDQLDEAISECRDKKRQ